VLSAAAKKIFSFQKTIKEIPVHRKSIQQLFYETEKYILDSEVSDKQLIREIIIYVAPK